MKPLGHLLLLCLTLSLSFSARAEFPLFDEASRQFQPGFWDLQTQFNYFEANANYDKGGGSYSSLPSGYGYKLMAVDFGAHYGLSRRIGTFVSTQLAQAESKNPTDTRTYSSFTKAILGFDYLWMTSEKYDIFPEASLTFPAERVDTGKDEVINGERAIELRSQITARAKWGNLNPFASAGFTYRDEGRSALIPFAAGAEWKMKTVKIGAELRGYQSVIDDQYTNDQDKRFQIAPKNGNSLKFYSVNPSLLETNFWVRSNNKSDLGWRVGGGTTMTGANTAAGWNIFGGVSFGIEGSGAPIQRPSSLQPRPQQPKEDVDRFEEEISDGVNQNLFEKPKPPQPVAPPPPPAAPKVQSKMQKQRKKQIQKDLDKTEFQIELKRIKKRKKIAPN